LKRKRDLKFEISKNGAGPDEIAEAASHGVNVPYLFI
jgi:hypothetical protein